MGKITLAKIAKVLGLVGGIIAIIWGILQIFNSIGYFDYPNIVPSSHIGTDTICPGFLTYYFDLSYVNYGKADANLCVNIVSNEIKFKENKKCWLMPADLSRTRKETEFKFEQVSNEFSYNSSLWNVTIYYNTSYSDRNGGHIFSSKCDYGRYHSSSFELIK